jgi:hypothetical protein
MTNNSKPFAPVIDALGGSAKVATDLGYTVQRVNNWKRRGIPADVLWDNIKYFARVKPQINQARSA